MPAASQPIISVGAFLDQVGGRLEFTTDECHLVLTRNKTKQRILVAKRANRGLYRACMSPKDIQLITSSEADVNLSIHAQILREKINHLHQTLGHASPRRIKLVLQRNNFTNLKPSDVQLISSVSRRQDQKEAETQEIKEARRQSTPKIRSHVGSRL